MTVGVRTICGNLNPGWMLVLSYILRWPDAALKGRFVTGFNVTGWCDATNYFPKTKREVVGGNAANLLGLAADEWNCSVAVGGHSHDTDGALLALTSKGLEQGLFYRDRFFSK